MRNVSCHGIEYRGFHQSVVEELAAFSHVPVWNGLTDEFHPTQVLADLMTMEEFGERPLHTLSLCYLGDARFNMGNSLLIGGALMGMDVRIAAPRALWPHDDMLVEAQRIAELGAGWIPISTDFDYVRDGVARIRDAFVAAGVLDGQVGGRHGQLADAIDAGKLQLGEPARRIKRSDRRHGGFRQIGETRPNRRFTAHQRGEHLPRLVAVGRHHTQAGDRNVARSLHGAVGSKVTPFLATAARSSRAPGRWLAPVRPACPFGGCRRAR